MNTNSSTKLSAEEILKKHWDLLPRNMESYTMSWEQLRKYPDVVQSLVGAMKEYANQQREAPNEEEDRLVEDILSEFERIGIDTSEWEYKFGDGNFAHEFIALGIKDHIEKLSQQREDEGVTGDLVASDKAVVEHPCDAPLKDGATIEQVLTKLHDDIISVMHLAKNWNQEQEMTEDINALGRVIVLLKRREGINNAITKLFNKK